MGGNFLRENNRRIKTANDLVEAGLFIVNTEHGQAVISFTNQQLVMMKAMMMVKPTVVGIPLRFQLYRFGVADGAGNDKGGIWLWEMPKREGALT
jgi:hypothetical protein